MVLQLPLDYPVEDRPSIEGGGLNGKYIFQQLHFHWAEDNSQGSEHMVDSKPYVEI